MTCNRYFVAGTKGRTPLHEFTRGALSKSMDEKINDEIMAIDGSFAQYLIDKGADVNAKDKKGITPLHEAYNVFIAQVLLDSGADINAKNSKGRTPLSLALEDQRRNWKMIDFLKRHGAKN